LLNRCLITLQKRQPFVFSKRFEKRPQTTSLEPLDDCIRAYTIGSAYAQFDENRKGALKVGQFADFIILSSDLTKIPPSDYTKTQVLRTVVGGRTVYLAQ